MRIGSLFSGIGGIERGLERAGVGRVVWQCEREPAAQAVLRHHWKGVPVYDDICNLRGSDVEPVDVLCGGAPCQDISLAGKGAGLAGARSGLWFQYLRLIRELRPRFVVAENVAALVARGLDVVLGGLAESGYDSLWLPLRASDVGAPHRRERIFIIAWRRDVGPGRVSDADGGAVREQPERRGVGACAADERDAVTVDMGAGVVGNADSARLQVWKGERGDARQELTPVIGAGLQVMAHPDRDGRELIKQDEQGRRGLRSRPPRHDTDGRGEEVHEWPPGPADATAWTDYLTRHPGRAPAVDGKLNPGFVDALMGFPDGWTEPGGKRNARLKMLGNAVVPQCAEVIGHVLRGLM